MSDQIQTPTPAPVQSASGALVAGAALAGGALLFANAKSAHAVSPALTFSDAIFGTGDIKVLNYALSLEALETDLYVQALQRLTTGGTNALGKTITGLNLSESNAAVKYLRDFGKIEAAHKAFFEGALGSKAITKGSNALANAKFDFGFDDNNKATLAYVIEQVRNAEAIGVGAYIGAIPFFVTTTYLGTAAAIQGTEARHTATITAIINQLGINASGQPSPLPVAPLATLGHPTSKELSGIDVAIEPNAVLTKVSPFIVL
ncbi:Ferritin-like domain-containing protein [Abditibacterium utsteinense]|uniref:Ferritin-like domain-containing protein n=1 Tax=Abditibacterium utsteinense TaxID=1960156 RepID=A0A2S8SSQ3_9BACT|nr:ferritin-like domain-containing protein [Abditibacterium utsteinense]PQV63806.1 Ferritin-like domain-containing protein [Abditibacterium utsteinense]